MISCPPQVALALRTPGWDLASSQWGWDFHIVRGGIAPGVHHFCPWFDGLYVYGIINDAGIKVFLPWAALDLQSHGKYLATSQWSWGFHSVRSGVNPEDLPGMGAYFPRDALYLRTPRVDLYQ